MIELGTAITVLTASFIGVPVSTTHCLIGAIIAVGVVDTHGLHGVRWGLASKCVVSWVMTIPAAGFLSGKVGSPCCKAGHVHVHAASGKVILHVQNESGL